MMRNRINAIRIDAANPISSGENTHHHDILIPQAAPDIPPNLKTRRTAVSNPKSPDDALAVAVAFPPSAMLLLHFV